MMIKEIANRRSIRKYKQNEILAEIIQQIFRPDGLHHRERISSLGAVALGYADETPALRPRKPLDDIVEYRY